MWTEILLKMSILSFCLSEQTIYVWSIRYTSKIYLGTGKDISETFLNKEIFFFFG